MTAAPAIKPKLRYKLKVVAGPHLNEVYGLEQESISIGRGEDNQIKLIQDARISRAHVEIVWTGTAYRFRNTSQKNFVMLDGQVKEDGVLVPGSRLQLGETVIEVFEEGPILVSTSVAPPAPVAAPATAHTPAMRAQVQAAAAAKPSAPRSMVGVAGQSPAPARPLKQKRSPSYSSPQDSGKKNFYLIIGAVVLIFGWILTQPTKPKDLKTFRTSQQVEYDLLQSTGEKKKLEERLQTMQTETAKRAQENLIKGFRDYQQGNYSRARDNFQVVLNLDPENEIAKRYYHLSKIKFDELLQFNILQGLRYRDKKNYRMCRSSFQSALVMIQNNQNHPKYREIKNFFDECNLGLEGRF